MFAERFDALMNIAEVSNSLLGRDVHMSPSYIGRLRSGARPLPKNHEYLSSISSYIAGRIRKDYQINALSRLLEFDVDSLADTDSLASLIERWLLGETTGESNNADRPYGILAPKGLASSCDSPDNTDVSISGAADKLFYGNSGKRRAVELFFDSVLREKSPQTLLLFSDEDMSWLYEDKQFVIRWSELFKAVILAGNRVKIIHTISRDINEMMEAIGKWLPIYATGMVEPYFYPRLRDGIFRRTLFIAPKTAAITSVSIQNDTSEMLNHLITDSTAIDSLCLEYERYLSLCRPMMTVYTERQKAAFIETFENINSQDGRAIFCYNASDAPDLLKYFNISDSNLKPQPIDSLPEDTILYIKENSAVIMIKLSAPGAAFVINAPNLVNAFWDYFILASLHRVVI